MEGGALLAPSCTLYAHNTICVQEKYMMDPDPKRCRASPSPLMQVEMCAPYERPLQAGSSLWSWGQWQGPCLQGPFPNLRYLMANLLQVPL